MSFIKKYYREIIIYALVIAELYVYLHVREINHSLISSSWLLLLGVLIGLLVFLPKQSTKTLGLTKKYKAYAPAVVIVMGMSLLALWAVKTQAIIDLYPIDATYSDILPQMDLYNGRLFDGTKVYQEHYAYGWYMFPNWMPMQWLPFSLSYLSGIDHRWIPFLAFAALQVLVIIRLFNTGLRNLLRSGSVILFFGLLPILIADYVPEVQQFSVEWLVAFYYGLLCLALTNRNYYLLGVAIGLCLLSRYSLMFWLPIAFVVLFFADKQNRKKLFTAVAISMGLVICIYVLPFYIWDTSILTSLFAYYKSSIYQEWYSHLENGIPTHLGRGYGLGIWFYNHIEGSLQHKIDILQKTQFVSMALVSLVSLTFYFLFKQKIKNPWLLLLGVLKIILVIFYAFVAIPYEYLFVVSLTISGFVLMNIIARNDLYSEPKF